MNRIEIEKLQHHYNANLSLSQYKQGVDYKKMSKAIELAGSGKKQLDIGSGNGLLAMCFENDVTCIDVNRNALAEMKRNGLSCKYGSANKIPFKSNSFDVVSMCEVIEHIKPARPALTEIRRVLKEEGKAIITTPNFTSLRDRVLALFGHMPAYSMHPDHINFYNKRRLIEEMEEAGFREVACYGTMFVLPVPRFPFPVFKIEKVVPITMLDCLIAEGYK